MPWQQYVADVALELDDDGLFSYDEVDVVVGRQEGKTALKMSVGVHRLAALVATHGPQRAAFTMQTRAKARTKLERDYAPRLRTSRMFREVPHAKARPQRPTDWKLSLNNGSENIQFGPASYLQIDAPSRTGTHGDTLDLGLIDEAFAHQDDTVEQAMSPTMATRRDHQLWVLSASGDGKSKYLYRKIVAGRAAVDAGESGRVAYFEWSAADELDPGDPVTWRAACPALGITISERFLRSEWEKAQRRGREGIDSFRRAYLCQWPEVPLLDDELQYRVIPSSSWVACAKVSHRAQGVLRYALDVDVNARGEEWASVGCSDGTHVEIVTTPETGAGTDWVVPAVARRKHEVGELLVDPHGPAGKLIGPLESAGVTIRPVRPLEFTQGSMQFLDGVLSGQVRHIDQPQLNRAVAGVARRDVGDGAWRFSRKLSPVDVGPLVVVMLARWAACQTGGQYEVLDSVL